MLFAIQTNFTKFYKINPDKMAENSGFGRTACQGIFRGPGSMFRYKLVVWRRGVLREVYQ